jgi:hypothetical protein
MMQTRVNMTKTTALFGLLCLLARTVGASKHRNLKIDYMLGSICGSVKEDTNGDGVGDVNLSDVTVTIFDSYDYQQGSTTTDKNGNYCFYNLDRKEYVIIETNPSGYTDVSDAKISVSLLAGQAMTGQDFIDKKLIGSPVYPGSPAASPITPTTSLSRAPYVSTTNPVAGNPVTGCLSGKVTQDSNNDDVGDR